jgi:hypothetical protein
MINKKRNTFIIFEMLLREQTDAMIKNDKDKFFVTSEIIKNSFTQNRELGKEIILYNQINEYMNFQNKNSKNAVRFLELLKEDYKKINKSKLFKEQTKLVEKINTKLGKQFYSIFVPEYKNLMNIYSYISDNLLTSEKLMVENKVLDLFQNNDVENEVMDYMDDILLSEMIKKFNVKYGKILSEQKEFLSNYMCASGESTADFLIYLNNTLSSLKTKLIESKKTKYVREDPTMIEKTDEIIKKLDEFKDTKDITENMLFTVLKVQELVKEINEN